MALRIENAAKALIAKYREIWPGSWPAMPEAIQLATATLDAVGGMDQEEIEDLHDAAEFLANNGDHTGAAAVSKAACLLDNAAYQDAFEVSEPQSIG